MVETLLRCPGCGQAKPETAFALCKARRTGRQSQCRACRKVADRERFACRSAEAVERRRLARGSLAARNTAWLLAYLIARVCVDCGASDVRVLEFDHLGDKVADVSRLVQGASLDRVRAEIAKCDVVCANCHKIRTRARLGDYRHRAWLAAGGQDAAV